MIGLLRELRTVYLLRQWHNRVKALPVPRLLNRDDATPQEIETADAARRAGVEFHFAGDLPTGHPLRAYAEQMLPSITTFRDVMILAGMCARCGTRVHQWPITVRQLESRGWLINDPDGPAMMLLCPMCSVVHLERMRVNTAEEN